jgi:hypothetical protein
MQILLITPLFALGFYMTLCGLIWQWQERLTFFPSRKIRYLPADYGLPCEEVWLRVPGQERDRVHGWWLPVPNAQQVVLLLHGNGFNMGANLAQAKVFFDLGYTVFLIDYRGYGRSEGSFPTETQVYTDAQIALDYLLQQRHLTPAEIIVFGHSLGGAIAIELAMKNPNLAALIIQGSFTSLREMVDHDGYYGWLPIDLLMRQSFNSIDKVAQLPMPLFFVHGDGDRRVPSWMSEKLYTAATTPLKALYILPGVDHNHVPEMGGEPYRDRVQHFLTQVTANSQQPRV